MQSGAVEAGNQIPFSGEHELEPLLKPGDTVPGQPLISHDDETVEEFLKRELSTARLESIYWMLFLVSNLRNISPLHHQLVKGRQIVITERPDLHLVWHYDRIFIKPVPRCLLNHAFWRTHLLPDHHMFTAGNGDGDGCASSSARLRSTSASRDKLRVEAQGFLRTYARLVVHESDFDLMKKLRLVPDHVDWEAWCRFMQGFVHLNDSQVSPRYHYGELRLTRLNFWSCVFLRGQNYFEVYHNYVTYFGCFGTPCLFIFGAVTVVLSALQCALQVYPKGKYLVLAASFVPFSIALTFLGLASFPLLYVFFQVQELLLFNFRRQKLS
ncbi:hypothetical protein EG329_003890 [Mollisiaceae sp. DMI_Dod_QoI]|nr:hypothetical protein EG329_003890 [Helotiales sp. DMI_Dod_QoI]